MQVTHLVLQTSKRVELIQLSVDRRKIQTRSAPCSSCFLRPAAYKMQQHINSNDGQNNNLAVPAFFHDGQNNNLAVPAFSPLMFDAPS